MKIKNTVCSIIAILTNITAAVLCFLPFVYQLTVQDFDPLTSSFGYTGETYTFNIFFNPQKYFDLRGISVSGDVFSTVLAFALVSFAIIGVIFGILSFFKNKVSLAGTVSTAISFILLIANTVNVIKFEYVNLTWKYIGQIIWGVPLIMLFLVLSAVLYALSFLFTKKK